MNNILELHWFSIDRDFLVDHFECEWISDSLMHATCIFKFNNPDKLMEFILIHGQYIKNSWK